MTKLRRTSATTIVLVFLVMNLDKILRDLLLSLLEWPLQKAFNRIEDAHSVAAQVKKESCAGSKINTQKIRQTRNFSLNLFPNFYVQIPLITVEQFSHFPSLIEIFLIV
jgi:hypothetical protein